MYRARDMFLVCKASIIYSTGEFNPASKKILKSIKHILKYINHYIHAQLHWAEIKIRIVVVFIILFQVLYLFIFFYIISKKCFEKFALSCFEYVHPGLQIRWRDKMLVGEPREFLFTSLAQKDWRYFLNSENVPDKKGDS